MQKKNHAVTRVEAGCLVAGIELGKRFEMHNSSSMSAGRSRSHFYPELESYDNLHAEAVLAHGI